MERILDFVKTLLLPHVKPAGNYLDFTMGNGHDTLFLAQHTQSVVTAFDIQPQALASTQKRLEEHGVSNVRLILDSHHRFLEYVNDPIDAAVFNLGYLPNGDKSVTTLPQTTLQAVSLAVNNLCKGGLLVIVLYPGHPQGKLESELIEPFCISLNAKEYDVLKYDFINKSSPPYILAVLRK
ncbi:class I SAM-dependent methyltransferase [Massiliimalia timonensis]|uniref:class I SAM-dependent methyltransferase n=1 Tax=Massiliimalia timonensis TaxID=1987501 RepID=UPI001A9B720E|nr:class I SAM-dependent methyltransferase [Massiliimalia timonensis]